ncbi:MAG: hypothetical protein AUK35_03710 [Zetaproteobacteria bacterium CG2_30_46_52]|nr:MAG: hypothetical protein AUK35_03710 [Zetaproteobacteria bacterium CG2_30_46_52]
MRYTLSSLLLSLALLTACGQSNNHEPTKILLSEQASTLVSNDEVLIQFRVEARGTDSNKLRESVDKMSKNIIRALSQENGVSITTTSRRTDPTYGKGKNGQERNGWMVSQMSSITSNKLDAVPHWLEAIEAEGALLQGLQFKVSDELHKRTQAMLRLQAISQFQQQAADVAKAMSASSYQVNQLQTSGTFLEPIMQQRSAAPMMMRAESLPVLEAGESRIRVDVSGEIEISKTAFPVSQVR